MLFQKHDIDKRFKIYITNIKKLKSQLKNWDFFTVFSNVPIFIVEYAIQSLYSVYIKLFIFY